MSSLQGVSRVFHMQGFGSFLLHFTLRFSFPPHLHPFRHNRDPRSHPSTRSFCILYSRTLPASSHLPFSHSSLRIISRLVRYVSSLSSSSCCFHLILSFCIFLSFLPRTMHISVLFYHVITLALLSYPSSHPHLFFSFFPSL